MSNFSSASRTLIAVLALASITVGCHKKETTAVDTTATTATVVPATPVSTGTTGTTDKSESTGASGTRGTSGSGTAGGNATAHAGANPAGASHVTTGSMSGPSGVKNNTGQTQGTTPGTSLPTSDGAR